MFGMRGIKMRGISLYISERINEGLVLCYDVCLMLPCVLRLRKITIISAMRFVSEA